MTTGAAGPLAGAIDLHLHAAPDVRPRKATMLEVTRAAAAAGMRAIVFKSHHEHTAGHATVLRGLVPGIEVFGGITLNRFIGGLNPDAVEVAAALGAKLVWLPTLSAAYYLRMQGLPAAAGITVLEDTDRRRLTGAAQAVLEVAAARRLVLCSGHLAPPETVVLATEARRRGVRAVVVNHPDMPFVDFPVELQGQLARLDGIFFERCYNAALRAPGHGSFERLVGEIRAVGTETTILASDLGQPENPFPVQGLSEYYRRLGACGFADAELERMGHQNPARVLGL